MEGGGRVSRVRVRVRFRVTVKRKKRCVETLWLMAINGATNSFCDKDRVSVSVRVGIKG